MNIKEKLEQGHIKQAIYKYGVEVMNKDKLEFPEENFVFNEYESNNLQTEFEIHSTNSSNWGQGDVIIQINHETEKVKISEQNIDGENWSKKTRSLVAEKSLNEILKEYGLSKEEYKEAYKEKVLEKANSEVERDNYKENYKDLVIGSLNEQNGKAKENIRYKDLFKKGILRLINAMPNHSVDKNVNKEGNKVDREKNVREMKKFEKSHSFEVIYQLRKEVFAELKEMKLTDLQKEKLLKLEKNLDKQKQEYDKKFRKDDSKKEVSIQKQKQKTIEMER